MTDAELIEKMALDMYPAITMSVGETIAEKHINMVREEMLGGLMGESELWRYAIEKERAKVKAEMIAIVEGFDSNDYECRVDGRPEDLLQGDIIKALEEV